jgi:glycerol-3-phosphate dehydrogenase
LQAEYGFLTPAWAKRLVRAYGTEAREILGATKTVADLGQDFGATLSEAEVTWLMSREYALSAEDVVWRRSKLGLRLSPLQISALDDHIAAARQNAPVR